MLSMAINAICVVIRIKVTGHVTADVNNMSSVSIVMYYWGGKKFGITIKTECEECDINMGILKEMEKKEFENKPVSIIIKPWLTHFWEVLFTGGWHAPIILTNGKIFSQGVVIDRERLAQKVQTELSINN